MKSQLKDFYKNKTIFLTGGSGFLGKVIIEKVLRATEVSRIYVLIRSKRGKNAQERINEWKTDPLFGVLLKAEPNALERIVVISGDCAKLDLGISAANREVLKNEVQVLVHCAATVKFSEPLHKALDINTRATHLLLKLAKEMSRLVAFLYVSTAFSNCVIQRVSEQFYSDNLKFSVEKVMQIKKVCGNIVLDGMASSLMGKFPNTYTFTKALAEQVIQNEAMEMPVCVFRPGAIVASSKEPMSGWIDNIYGPIAMVYGSAIGVLRIAPINDRAPNHIVPVDYCANAILACIMQTTKQSSSTPTIYNYVPHESNPLTNKGFNVAVSKHRNTCPLEQAIWYPFLHTTSIYWLFKLIAVFYHTLPGYVIDLGLLLRGHKPRMIELYKKVHKSMDALSYFSTGFWTFETTNIDRLWQSLSTEDKEHFDFDMTKFDWDDYFANALVGMRVHIAKEDPSDESIKRGREHMKRLERRHRMLQLIICLSTLIIFKWVIGLYL